MRKMIKIYAENAKSENFLKIPYDEQDADKAYVTHFKNFQILRNIEKSGTFAEKCDAREQIEICQRKMENRMRHRNFDPCRVGRNTFNLRNK